MTLENTLLRLSETVFLSGSWWDTGGITGLDGEIAGILL
jgi:hypothetical protein